MEINRERERDECKTDKETRGLRQKEREMSPRGVKRETISFYHKPPRAIGFSVSERNGRSESQASTYVDGYVCTCILYIYIYVYDRHYIHTRIDTFAYINTRKKDG